MTSKDELLELRSSMGMNRREFCEYFEIPYRTVQDWEGETGDACVSFEIDEIQGGSGTVVQIEGRECNTTENSLRKGE